MSQSCKTFAFLYAVYDINRSARCEESSVYEDCVTIFLLTADETALAVLRLTFITCQWASLLQNMSTKFPILLVDWVIWRGFFLCRKVAVSVCCQGLKRVNSWTILKVQYFGYFVQNVIDGDLCEIFNSMDLGKQKSVAEELDRTPSEVGWW